MSLLDLQTMETPEPQEDELHGGGSEISLTLCNSAASVTLCL
ncbi:SapB/AmfS family lanthipeptide [Streptomyces sp. Ru72]|nr:SapB/AmfS family lanthipeptide [Streptomyces sp. Ru72]POX45285.1 SapB/AmfS family lantipeptide [Streptomyces sp. Ru72]